MIFGAPMINLFITKMKIIVLIKCSYRMIIVIQWYVV